MKLHLRVEAVGQPPDERAFDEGELTVGRSATADLVLPDASVSRQHARLVFRDDAWWLEPVSTRGTFVNGRALDDPRPLQAGDEVRLGNSCLRMLGAPGVPYTAVRTIPEVRPLDAARLEILNDVHRALATAISLSELLDLILERCFDVLRPEEGVILLRQANGALEVAASRSSAQGDQVVVSRLIIEEVADRGRSTLVLDTAEDERFVGSESIELRGIRSVLAAPLTDVEGTLGLIVLQSRIRVRTFTQDDLTMLESLASAAALRVRNVALTEEAAARRVLEREMALAHDMQMSMLPRRMPDRPELDMAASLASARSVGGDLYDFMMHGDRLWFTVADVSDKGMAAALHTAVVKTLFRATVQGDVDLSQVLERMNRELCRENDQMVFVTGLVGHLDLATGEVMLGDAGHNPAVVVRPDGHLGRPALPKGIALGVQDEAQYAAASLRLAPGETLLLYTDGATDARNPDGEMFGEQALERAIASAPSGAPRDLVTSIVEAVERFSNGAPPEDDLTLLAVRYRGPRT